MRAEELIPGFEPQAWLANRDIALLAIFAVITWRFAEEIAASGLEVADLAIFAAAWRARVAAPAW